MSDLSDFLDEAFSLIYLLTANSISPEKWQMLDFLHGLFDRSHMVEHHFVDLMPALHNYVTVDAQAFLSNPNHAMHIFDLCRKVCVCMEIIIHVFRSPTHERNFHRFLLLPKRAMKANVTLPN